MSILVLGGRGFLGQTLVEHFNAAGVYPCLVIRGEETEFGSWIHVKGCGKHGKQFESCSPTVVINAAATWKTTDTSVLKRDNFDFPQLVLQHLGGNPTRWIQTNSFFNYAFDLEGFDLDPYAYWRRQASEKIQNLSTDRGFEFSEIRLPHLIGGSSDRDRMVPALVRALVENRNFDINRPNVFLPVVHVSDAARQIALLALAPHSLLGRELAWLSDQMTVGEAAIRTAKILAVTPSLIHFKKDSEPQFPSEMLEFPETSSLDGVQRRLMSFEEMILDLREGQSIERTAMHNLDSRPRPQ